VVSIYIEDNKTVSVIIIKQIKSNIKFFL